MKQNLLIVFICSSLIARADFWTQKADFTPGGRGGMFSFAIGTKGYVGCGYGAGVFKDCWEYDPVADTWTQEADYGGIACWYPVGFSVGSKGYVGLGYENGNFYTDVWEFDPVANTWTQKNNYPYATRFVRTSISQTTKGYIVCGGNSTDLVEYDPPTDTWTILPSLPGTARLAATGFSIGTKLYFGTGQGGAGTLLNDFWEYDIPSSTWTQLADFGGIIRADAAGFSIGSKGYLGTGETIPFGTFLKDFWEYNPATNIWTQKTDYGILPADETAFFSIGGKGYIGMGAEGSNFDFWEYCPDSICAGVLPVAIFSAANHICPGTCLNFNNLSTNATSYEWTFPGATPSVSTDINPANICYNTSGSYDVQLIATNSSGSDTLLLHNYIIVYPAPPPQGIQQSGDTLFANIGATTYQWYFNGTLIPAATDYFYVAQASGDYNVVATDANGCEVEAAIFSVIAAVLPSPLGEGSGVRLYPNPVVDKLEITGSFLKDKKEINISIYNLIGEKVLAVSPLSLGRGVGGEADVSALPSGMYYLQVSSATTNFRTKFIKQ